MKVWCPNNQCECEDGHTTRSEYPCVFWDTLDEICLLRENFQNTHDAFVIAKKTMESLDD